MGDQTYEQELLDHVRKLSADKQRRVLEFVKDLVKPQGTPGKLAVQYAREIHISSEDLAAMEKAIEEACEVIEDFPDVKFND
jgi:hypothetical protein